MNFQPARFFAFAFTLAALCFLPACSKKSSSFFEAETYESIISTRPQNRTHFMALYRLKSPALLAGTKASTKNIDPELLEKIDKEQESFIASAKALSSEVRVLNRYRLVLNGVALLAPVSVQADLKKLQVVSQSEMAQTFARPEVTTSTAARDLFRQSLNEVNSVRFIGAHELHATGIKGANMSVGVIDTGIDYTHSMFGGAGTEEAFKATDPKLPSEAFPNAKVVGGIDLVGTEYNAASEIFALRIPNPDVNPIDEGGHGTHVAGTVAGLGDGINTYSGVAPEALLHSIKVFGKDGSTSDDVVIAALEYAADPNRDLNLSDALHVVNLSLGSGYGTPHILYAEAVKNLSLGGTAVVASAGNSGAEPHIVGAPSVSEEALSVAAGIDSSERNWKFRAVEVIFPGGEKEITEAVESPIAKPLSEVSALVGEFVFAGFADKEFSEELKQKLKGKVALIDRGLVTFGEKMKRAEEAGAVAVVVANNSDGAPFAMGGDGKIGIPALMIPKALRNKILNSQLPVQINFVTSIRIEKPELIDTLTDFSSQGPRSLDSLIKPEITAPGLNIISAKMGGGSVGVALSGTSMSGPHMAGVMALLRQQHPELSVRELKSIAMGNVVSIKDAKGEIYPVSRQGSGRIQVARAGRALVTSGQVSISLGEVGVNEGKRFKRSLSLKNLSSEVLQVSVRYSGSEQIRVESKELEVPARGSKDFDLVIDVLNKNLKAQAFEASGFIQLYLKGEEIHRWPILGILRPISWVESLSLRVFAGSSFEAAGSLSQLSGDNKSAQKAKLFLFNLLGLDSPKPAAEGSEMSRSCDLRAGGYRIQGERVQFAAKLHETVTTWHNCEVSVEIDKDADGSPDFELVGAPQDRLQGLAAKTMSSILIDAKEAREIRKAFEQELEKNPSAKVDYSKAVVSLGALQVFDHGDLMILNLSIKDLGLVGSKVRVRMTSQSLEETAVEADDQLGGGWMNLSVLERAQGYRDLPETLEVSGGQSFMTEFTKGGGSHSLGVFMPTQAFLGETLSLDRGLVLLQPEFGLK